MNLSEYQEVSSKHIKMLSREMAIVSHALSLVAEAAELADILAIDTHVCHRKLEAECGDNAFYCAALATAIDTSLSEIVFDKEPVTHRYRSIESKDRAVKVAMTAANVARIARDHTFHGKPLDIALLRSELGDHMCHVMALCDERGIRFADALDANVRSQWRGWR